MHRFRNNSASRCAYRLGLKRNTEFRYTTEQAVSDVSGAGIRPGDVVMFSGHMFFGPQLDCVRRLSEENPECQHVVLDERTTEDGHFSYASPVMRIGGNLWIARAPEILWKDAYHKFEDVEAGRGEPELTGYCAAAAQNLRRRHYDMGEGYPEEVVREAHRYFSGVIEALEPRLVVMWNQFHAVHTVLDGVCGDMGVPRAYMEFGPLPHTYVVDDLGQMGRSRVAAMGAGDAGPPDPRGLETARATVAGFREQLHARGDLKMGGRPAVLYVGQNDCESGMVPYTDESRAFHSPVFRNTAEGLERLSEICRSRGWSLTFRPHPIYSRFELMKGCRRLARVDGESRLADQIASCDVVVTILSSSAYTALALDKPVVMLGYTQLRGKGCTYEAFDGGSVEAALDAALRDGLTEEMRSRFLEHVSHIQSSYLYEDGTGLGAGQGVRRMSNALRRMALPPATDGGSAERGQQGEPLYPHEG